MSNTGSIVTSTSTYDTLNRLISDKDGKNQTLTNAYDAVGRKTSYTDAKGATFRFQFDALSVAHLIDIVARYQIVTVPISSGFP